MNAILSMPKTKPTPHWQALVDTWFTFHTTHKGFQPRFVGPQTKALKEIASGLQNLSEAQNIEWTQENATRILTRFLSLALKNKFLYDKFQLHIINQQFDIIVASGNPRNRIDEKATPNGVHAELSKWFSHQQSGNHTKGN